MALTRIESFPFDSRFDGFDDEGYPVYDRAVGARMLRSAFAQFFADGVFGSDPGAFAIEAADGLSVTVAPGVAIINGAIGAVYEDAAPVKLDDGPTVGTACYAVFLRYDGNDDHRSLYIRTERGDYGADPVPPEPVREAEVVEFRLGYVTVPSNSTDLIAADIVMEKGSAVCPYAAPFTDIDVAGVLNGVRKQAQGELDDIAEFADRNIELVRAALDDTAAGYLQGQIDEMVRKDSLEGEAPISAIKKQVDEIAKDVERTKGETSTDYLARKLKTGVPKIIHPLDERYFSEVERTTSYTSIVPSSLSVSYGAVNALNYSLVVNRVDDVDNITRYCVMAELFAASSVTSIRVLISGCNKFGANVSIETLVPFENYNSNYSSENNNGIGAIVPIEHDDGSIDVYVAAYVKTYTSSGKYYTCRVTLTPELSTTYEVLADAPSEYAGLLLAGGTKLIPSYMKYNQFKVSDAMHIAYADNCKLLTDKGAVVGKSGTRRSGANGISTAESWFRDRKGNIGIFNSSASTSARYYYFDALNLDLTNGSAGYKEYESSRMKGFGYIDFDDRTFGVASVEWSDARGCFVLSKKGERGMRASELEEFELSDDFRLLEHFAVDNTSNYLSVTLDVVLAKYRGEFYFLDKSKNYFASAYMDRPINIDKSTVAKRNIVAIGGEIIEEEDRFIIRENSDFYRYEMVSNGSLPGYFGADKPMMKDVVLSKEAFSFA